LYAFSSFFFFCCSAPICSSLFSEFATTTLAVPDLRVCRHRQYCDSARCHDRLLGRDVDVMRIKAGIERAVVDVLRKLGFLEGPRKGRPPLRVVETEDDGGPSP
jgi:hypothetical protein